jgi:hypothetical protein
LHVTQIERMTHRQTHLRSSFSAGAGPKARRCGLLLCCGLTALLLGCGEEEQIRNYKVPKEPPPAVAVVLKPGEIEGRTLGAIFPDGESSWFIKVHGRRKPMDAHSKEFDEFIQSIRLTGKPDDPLQWKVPAGWEEQKSQVDFIRNVFLFGPKPDQLRLTVSRASGSVLSNVNRWRKEVGLDDISEGQLKQASERLDVNGVSVIKVDVTGRLFVRPMGMGR